MLSVIMRCIESNVFTPQFDLQKLIDWYVGSFGAIYGECYVSFNVHSFLHILEDRICNPNFSTSDFSAFMFEDLFQTLKGLVRGRNRPLEQVERRIHEIGGQIQRAKKKISMPKFLPANFPSDAIAVVSGRVCRVMQVDGDEHLVSFFVNQEDLFSRPPGLASLVGCWKCWGISDTVCKVSFRDLKKCCAFQNTGYIAVVLLL